ncbi:ATP-binding cassette domain-containing protein [Ramlibacter sp.]|uniref:ATP-binding cassette domain-containing protein n=1 Tax=Ramlibacter sp. TaxID=1917967 RepID=UPI0017C4D1EE|nr:ATP-binding cassette domain-containing protein [Ramlibacter sp.]MBA2675943.1 ATP-binding cassette domain-containing protein [Ramlibacter sp.]
MSTPQALALLAVSIRLHGRALIAPLDAAIAPGECLTLMGPSGSGKSTLLNYLAGTLPKVFEASGRVSVGDVDLTLLPPERRGVGILFQDDLLFPHLSVGGNLAFAMPAAIRASNERRDRVDAALKECGLDGLANRDPATLSGGQRARVALMRTLLALPRVLLLDEPFNKLDTRLRSDFREFVFSHARQHGLPTVLVTHDEDDAQAAAGRVITLDEP